MCCEVNVFADVNDDDICFCGEEIRSTDFDEVGDNGDEGENELDTFWSQVGENVLSWLKYKHILYSL